MIRDLARDGIGIDIEIGCDWRFAFGLGKRDGRREGWQLGRERQIDAVLLAKGSSELQVVKTIPE